MRTWLSLFLFASTIYAQSIGQLVYEIRDPGTQAPRFRECLEKIGEYLALDVASHMPTEEVEITTLTGGIAKHQLLSETPVLVTILRAGLPLTTGVQRVFPTANTGFIAMSRNEETLKADVSYVAIPDVENKCVIIVDTMLATGGSFLDAIRIIEASRPKKIIVVAAIASEFGIAQISNYDPNIELYIGATDPSLNDKGYIIPGLGDAGDRCYGTKHPLGKSNENR
jgi:uracil phosphoribosyltransferase